MIELYLSYFYAISLHRYFIIYKPYQMISQFVSPYQQKLLCDLEFEFPPGTHAVGRLDYESEGLLILTTDKTMTRRLLHPDKKHKRTYLVQVQNQVQPDTLHTMRSGMAITIKGKGVYKTGACKVEVVEKPGDLPENGVAENAFVKYSWLQFTLTEGKNRQIRRMCAATRHKCRRLIRTHIEDLSLGNLKPGEVMEMDQPTLFGLLNLD